MVTTTWGLQGLNPETQNVMNYMSGHRTKKQVVWEFFGLREEAVYDDEWTNVVDFINDFKDIKVLEKKWVHYSKRLITLWVSEADFNNLFYWETPNYERIKWGSNAWESWEVKAKQGLSDNNEWAELNTKDVKWSNTKWRSGSQAKRKVNNKK